MSDQTEVATATPETESAAADPAPEFEEGGTSEVVIDDLDGISLSDAIDATIIEFDEGGDRCQHLPHCSVCLLHMAKVTRVLHDDTAEMACRLEPVGMSGKVLVHIEHAGAECSSFSGTEEVPVVLECRTASG